MQEGVSWAYNRNYEDILQDIASKVGISRDECQACIKDDNLRNMVLSHTRQVGDLADFIGVPTIYINGKIYEEDLETDNLCQVIDGI